MKPVLGWVVSIALGLCACGSDGTVPSSAGSKAGNDGGTGKKGGAGSSASKDAGVMRGAPTFSAIYKEIIVGTGCNAGGLCHGVAVGNLMMSKRADAYQALVGVKAMGMSVMPGLANCVDSGLTRVEPGKPEESLLMKKIEQMQPCGQPMPPSGMLPANQIEQIRTWIMNGANDD